MIIRNERAAKNNSFPVSLRVIFDSYFTALQAHCPRQVKQTMAVLYLAGRHFPSAASLYSGSQPCGKSVSYAEPNYMGLDEAESDDHDRPAGEQPGAGGGNYAGLKQETRPGIFHMAAQNAAALCLSIWLIVAVGLLIRKVTIYQSFVKYINAGRVEKQPDLVPALNRFLPAMYHAAVCRTSGFRFSVYHPA